MSIYSLASLRTNHVPASATPVASSAPAQGQGRERPPTREAEPHPRCGFTLAVAGASPARASTVKARAMPSSTPMYATTDRNWTPSALISFVAYGYRVEPGDRAKCPRVAALLQLRLMKELHIEEPMVTGMEVRCMSLRGNTFLLALAYSASLDASTLPDRLQHAFSRVAKQPATAAEEKLMDRHLKQALAQQEEDDLERGIELAREVAQPRSGPLDPSLLLSPPTRLPRGAVQDFARRTFTPERQVMVNFSPFAG
ncbi:hypothetical protein JRI60_51115 [Archangium violaceum]|uniref:hypothetical protein n=1 Tax=Archangium violaceum TaxID=83451 RepID=UPI0019510C4E|nr:hypothetical protein [Archangium violaceum]QRN97209.1 hypothetical protein JRI60_51115 [Archangium violaceum]